MADIVYFSGELTREGEIQFVKQEVHVHYNAAPEITPVAVTDTRHADPTLTIFYEPQELHEDDEHAVG